MSTKTAFKRVALVAAAALAIGGISAVSAQAALTSGTNVVTWTATGSAGTSAAATVGGVVGTPITLTMTQTIAGAVAADTTTLLPVLSGTGTGVTVAAMTTANGASTGVTSQVITAGSVATTISAAAATVTSTYTFTPVSIGTYVLTDAIAAGQVTTAGGITVTVTTNTSPLIGGTSSASTAKIVTGNYTAKTLTSGTADNVYTITSTGVGAINYPGAPVGSTLTSGVWSNGTGAIGTGGNFTGAETLAVSVYSAVAGTQVVTIKGNVSAAVTLTITWGLAQTVSAANSTAFIGAAGSTPVADATISSSATVGSNAANIAINVFGSDAASFTNGTASVAATVTGSGLVLINGTAGTVAGTGKVASFAGNVAFVHVSSDGTAGVGTIALTATDPNTGATVSLGSKTVTFVGSAAKFVAGTNPDGFIPVGGVDALPFTAVDANGAAASFPASIYAVSDNTAAATVTVSGGGTTAATVSVTGIAAGKANITLCNTAACTASTISVVVPVEVTKATAKSYTITFDQDSYVPGQKMKITVTAVDANGRPVGDGTVALFAAGGITSNLLLQSSGLPTGTTAALVGGAVTYTAYAPVTAGDVILTATIGTGVDSWVTGTTATVTGTTMVTSGAAGDAANAAVDAANEATDAANAATDAANAAADSADAATQAAQDAGDKADAALAAVVALSQQVTNVLAKVAALSKLLVRIIKKTHA